SDSPRSPTPHSPEPAAYSSTSTDTGFPVMLRRPGKRRQDQEDLVTVLREMHASHKRQMERLLELQQHQDQHLRMMLEDSRDARHQEVELAREQHQET
ncbi:hypothetical protein ABVT39_014083, partial [Epinephelus coioides]